MNNFFRGIIAAWGAKKLGGGCLSTIVIFIIIYTLLGKCGNESKAAIKEFRGPHIEKNVVNYLNMSYFYIKPNNKIS